jgi:tetrapyrrole methylase family protein/MazG family protein/ATP diphosphatase
LRNRSSHADFEEQPFMTSPEPSAIDRLLEVMTALRDPDGGCPWDIEQTFETIAPCTIEEAYEDADAIARGNRADLKEELGDLLFQVVYHSQIASEDPDAGEAFAFEDVAKAITDKMIRRHPHVFGDATVESAGAQSKAWEEMKAEERRLKGKAERESLLDDVSLALPALTRAEKLQKRAARGGFDWPETRQVLDKIDEELSELKVELESGAIPDRVEDELGDLLFTVANLARHLKVDPEEALRRTNRKFEQRFRAVEQALSKDGRAMIETPLDDLESLWQAAKGVERR